MSKELKKYKARIFGESYSIVSDEDEAVILSVVHKVDALMQDISDKSGFSDTKQIAVLAALQATEELVNLQKTMQDEQNQSDKIITLLEEEELSL